jgi:YjbE family integral membrane protein
MLQYLSILGSIILVDLALSGDNALVIGAAASSLPRRQRRIAILSGGSAAIVLRIVFTIAAALLLQLPFLQTIGAVLLIIIAVRLLVGQHENAHDGQEGASGNQTGFWAALFTILIADVTMSLDNILAIAALARNEIPLLIIGLLISVFLLLVGSAIVAELIQRLPWLMDLAALVLGWTAARMILDDKLVSGYLDQLNLPFLEIIIPIIAIGIVAGADIFLRWRATRSTGVAKG